jgi:hypothetical protein
MDTVRLKHSILADGTQLMPVDLLTWGERKLAESEIARLSEANASAENYLAASNISVTVIKETINDQDIDIGIEVVFPNFEEFKNTDIYKDLYSWAQRMRDDSDIRVFNWVEEIS